MYEVNFPDQRFRWISELEIYVRCNAPCEDPTETLVLKSHETAAFHGPRLALVKALINQRAVSRGLTGLTSARIELFAHQVEVVRRVLEDPVQRYLLADEVGLGKTIEAGVLIRQYLLDEAEGHVVVLVPPLLIGQWRGELDVRFDAFYGDRVHVVSTAELDRVPAHFDIGMLVVDEAHHVAASAASGDAAARAAFEVCRHLAQATERVILLSATPAANHEAQFLAMLHLLDPHTYRLEDVEAFRERVRMRQEIGRLLLTVTEEAHPFSLKLNLPKLAALFPNDQRLTDLGRDVLALLERDPSDAAARAKLIRAIRTHVSETYRLHRRMLRNRRGAIPDAIFDRADQRLVATRDEGEEAARLEQHRHVTTAFHHVASSREYLAEDISSDDVTFYADPAAGTSICATYDGHRDLTLEQFLQSDWIESGVWWT
jgi:ATP-dependent helicase HepA